MPPSVDLLEQFHPSEVHLVPRIDNLARAKQVVDDFNKYITEGNPLPLKDARLIAEASAQATGIDVLKGVLEVAISKSRPVISKTEKEKLIKSSILAQRKVVLWMLEAQKDPDTMEIYESQMNLLESLHQLYYNYQGLVDLSFVNGVKANLAIINATTDLGMDWRFDHAWLDAQYGVDFVIKDRNGKEYAVDAKFRTLDNVRVWPIRPHEEIRNRYHGALLVEFPSQDPRVNRAASKLWSNYTLAKPNGILVDQYQKQLTHNGVIPPASH